MIESEQDFVEHRTPVLASKAGFSKSYRRVVIHLILAFASWTTTGLAIWGQGKVWGNDLHSAITMDLPKAWHKGTVDSVQPKKSSDLFFKSLFK